MGPVRPLEFPLGYYVSVLQSMKDGRLYTGMTNDLSRRITLHNDGQVFSTQSRKPFRLVYYEAYGIKGDAQRRERYLKSGVGKRDLRKRLHGGLAGESREVVQMMREV